MGECTGSPFRVYYNRVFTCSTIFIVFGRQMATQFIFIFMSITQWRAKERERESGGEGDSERVKWLLEREIIFPTKRIVNNNYVWIGGRGAIRHVLNKSGCSFRVSRLRKQSTWPFKMIRTLFSFFSIPKNFVWLIDAQKEENTNIVEHTHSQLIRHFGSMVLSSPANG